MEIRHSVRRVPTRPIVLVMAFLSVLALALTSWYVMTSNAPHKGGGTISTTSLAPDADDRSQQILRVRGEQQSKAEATHGH